MNKFQNVIEAFKLLCDFLGIDYQLWTRHRPPDTFLHAFLKGELAYITQILVGDGAAQQCAQEFADALEEECVKNGGTVDSKVR